MGAIIKPKLWYSKTKKGDITAKSGHQTTGLNSFRLPPELVPGAGWFKFERQ
jgi:hypothetical protein